MTRNYKAPRRTTENIIAQSRIEHGMTQADLAQAIGTDQRMVSKWERGQFNVPVQMMRKISTVLDIPVEALINNVPERKRSPIKDIRRGKMTQAELADAIGVSQGLVSTYENGAHIPPETLNRIAEVLGVPVDAISPSDGAEGPNKPVKP